MKFDDYETVFIPGAPMVRKSFFFGREQEVTDLKRAMRRIGIHPIVIGDRGVGKTSLVNLSLRETKLPMYRINCNSQMTYSTLTHAILDILGLNGRQIELTKENEVKIDGKVAPIGIGLGAGGTRRESERRRGIGATEVTPWTLFTELRKVGKKVVLVMDEYDAFPAKAREIHSGIASLIKTLADNSETCDSRVVIVGVARSAESLLGKHESIERSAREIYLRTLRREDIDDFLTQTEKKLKFKFAPKVKKALIWSSMGYPYFVHLVGLESLDVMVERDRKARTVEEQDFIKGVERAVKKAFRSELRKYKTAVRGLGRREINIMRELARYPIARNITRKQLEHILVIKKKVMTSDEFNAACVILQQERRLLYVSRTKDSVRFLDPLMAPFLRASIYRDDYDKDATSTSQLVMFDEAA
jgi:Cdc6-like AAA superfamily ATPase